MKDLIRERGSLSRSTESQQTTDATEPNRDRGTTHTQWFGWAAYRGMPKSSNGERGVGPEKEEGGLGGQRVLFLLDEREGK